MESISKRYDNQGVSRVSRYDQLLCCCHCDGIALMNAFEYTRLFHALAARKLRPSVEERIWSESGRARLIGEAQVLHERCGVFLGHQRVLLDQDMHTLAYTEKLTPEMIQEIQSHYVLDDRQSANQVLEEQGLSNQAQRTQLLEDSVNPPVDEDAATSVKSRLASYGLYYVDGQFGRFSEEDLVAVHNRLYITEADRQAFRDQNRDNQWFPEPNDPLITRTLKYYVIQEEERYCQHCQQSVLAEAPGLRWQESAENSLYWHYDCYDFLVKRRDRKLEQELEALLTPLQLERLRVIIEKLERFPLQEYKSLKKTVATPDYEAFVKAFETRLDIWV
jgi:hypothetical protein